MGVGALAMLGVGKLRVVSPLPKRAQLSRERVRVRGACTPEPFNVQPATFNLQPAKGGWYAHGGRWRS